MFHLKTKFKSNKLSERNNCAEFGENNITFCAELNVPLESRKALECLNFLWRFYRSVTEVVIYSLSRF